MPQTPVTVDDLIVNSLYLIGELGVGEPPDAFMLKTGLELLNELMAKFTADSIYIPFLTSIDFNFVAGKSTYSFSDVAPADIVSERIVDLAFANYVVSGTSETPLVYPLTIIKKSQYYNVTRVDNLTTYPCYVFLDKQALESFLTFYPTPSQDFLCTIKVKCMIDYFEDQQDLNRLPPFYYGFLKRALARGFKQYYPSSNWSPEMEQEYKDYFDILKNSNETDMTIRPSIILNTNQPFVWPNVRVY